MYRIILGLVVFAQIVFSQEKCTISLHKINIDKNANPIGNVIPVKELETLLKNNCIYAMVSYTLVGSYGTSIEVVVEYDSDLEILTEQFIKTGVSNKYSNLTRNELIKYLRSHNTFDIISEINNVQWEYINK